MTIGSFEGPASKDASRSRSACRSVRRTLRKDCDGARFSTALTQILCQCVLTAIVPFSFFRLFCGWSFFLVPVARVCTMRCFLCGEEKVLAEAIPVEDMAVPGFEHQTLECPGCNDTERRLVFTG